MWRREKKQKTLLREVGWYRCLQYKFLEGGQGLLRRYERREEQETEGANESRTRKVTQAVGIGLKRNSGADIGGRDNWGIGQWDRE